MKKDVYIYQSGTLKRENNTLVLITKNDEKKIYLPIEQIDHIHVFGEVNINKRLLQFLNLEGIIMLYYSHYGKYEGSFIPDTAKSGKIIVEQVTALTDTVKRNHIVKIFEIAQLNNELALMKYYRKEGYLLDDCIRRIEVLKDGIDKLDVNNSNFLINTMLKEGLAKQVYYHGFDIILEKTDFEFMSRSTRPPRNELNAMMSYGYTLLYGDFLCAIIRSKLIPEISYIHSTSKNKTSLQFDMADMFKSVFVDRLILRLIRRKQITVDDFDRFKTGAVYLNDKGKKIYIEEYNKLLSKTVYDTRSKRNYSYAQIIKREIYLFIDYLLSDKAYKPYVMGW